MSFTLHLTPDHLANLEILHTGNDHHIVVPVGITDDGTTYHMVVGLCPLPGDLLEFYFHMAELSPEDHEDIVWDAQRIARIIPPKDRLTILVAVGVMARVLIQHVNPERFVMTLHDPSPPEKAMRKYHILNHVFAGCGYKITNCDDYHGITSWWLDRLA